jgi:hypothetical protein
MSFSSVAEMIEWAGPERALNWHLQSNHYPPVSAKMIAPCMEAISRASAGEWHSMVSLPSGVRAGSATEVSAAVLVDAFHLEAFVMGADDDL